MFAAAMSAANGKHKKFCRCDTPDIVNCIVYYNGRDEPLAGLNPDDVAYNCCIADCNEVNSNINDTPGFAYTTEPNNLPVVGNYHLAYNSPCVNTGDSNQYTDEFDIDGEPRVYGTLVDRGADEAYSCDQDLTADDVYHSLDWNADGLVNMEEFAVFSSAWLTEDPNQAFDSRCDLDTDDDVDLADLIIFCDPNNWLWRACWRTDLQSMAAQQSNASSSSMPVPSAAEGMMLPMSMETAVLAETAQPEPDVSSETLLEIIVFVDDAIKERPDNIKSLKELKDILEDWLDEIDLQ